ncbi:MAG TPA: DUF3788 family protein [Prolixibacteraceae bacterium]|nr:DUF3788 family protein [Prolixibacteraceae bacterium]HPS13389.1 DUF3788 family protein [Prolixibacteraceae bacterium]
METIQLRDPQILPTSEVLAGVLGDSYPVFDKLIKTVTDPAIGLAFDWHYYNDGKAWLCKVVFKKKTVFWLSAWDGYFKTTFYFTEKNCTGIFELGVDQSIIDNFNNREAIGKLLPLLVEMKQMEQLPDLLKIIEYKKKLK